MVEKCANPRCSARFRTLREGRVFVKEIEGNTWGESGRRSRQLRYFWLCSSCCRTMTVVAENGRNITVAPLSGSATVARAAS